MVDTSLLEHFFPCPHEVIPINHGRPSRHHDAKRDDHPHDRIGVDILKPSGHLRTHLDTALRHFGVSICRIGRIEYRFLWAYEACVSYELQPVHILAEKLHRFQVPARRVRGIAECIHAMRTNEYGRHVGLSRIRDSLAELV